MTFDEDVLGWWRWFEAHPERAWQERATTAHVASLLDAWGVSHRALGDDGCGLVAETGSGERTVGLRADLDAIWFGDDDAGRAVHACGHSAHLAIVLGALRLLHEEPAGVRVRALFQPAEELGTGAAAMVAAGAADGLDALLGVHLRPAEELPTGTFAPGLQSGASATLRIRLVGEPAHGARVHLGATVVEPFVAIHQLLASIRLNPNVPASAKITQSRLGGGSVNVIPGDGELAIDVRAQTNEAMRLLQGRIDAGLPHVASLYRVRLEPTWYEGTPAAEVGDAASAALAAAIDEVAGSDARRPVVVTPGADDFHVYTVERPALSGAMLAVGCGLEPGLHHPDVRYDTGPLPVAARILASAVRRLADG